ncbi:MAG: sulfur carrier protein ThiS [Chloroflexota bacterium]|nr:sulfur carrier protein ThiS [Chloroflexota bacterium]|tara:strand:- start:644 stop:865 length:222 start_codon:yes stop_codon:yes gene_type:complete
MNQDKNNITVFLNGKENSIPSNCTINDMLKTLNINSISIAIAINRNVIPKQEHGTFIIEDNSSIEIINAVGGG